MVTTRQLSFLLHRNDRHGLHGVAGDGEVADSVEGSQDVVVGRDDVVAGTDDDGALPLRVVADHNHAFGWNKERDRVAAAILIELY